MNKEDYQITLDDILAQKYVGEQPSRVAYIDECGNYGFDFEKEGTSKYYLLCAVIVEEGKLDKLRRDFEEVKKKSGFSQTELKSSKVPDNKRLHIMHQLLPLDFRIILFIADKEKFIQGSALTKNRQTFIKYLDQHLYILLYKAYPRLKIMQDEVGSPEFKESFKRYVENHRPEYNLFDQYEFDFYDSRSETLIQLADFIGGSIIKRLLDSKLPDYREMLSGKITAVEKFPAENEPYWGKVKPEECKYDSRVYALAIKQARDFISKFETIDTEDRKMQVEVIRYLLMQVQYLSPTDYIYADQLVDHIRECMGVRVTRNTLFRRVIAPLRDEGVILASCKKGYKIPISVDDLKMYFNQSLTTVGPMIHRMGVCRNIIKQGTDNRLDLFEDPALIRFKRYFDEKT